MQSLVSLAVPEWALGVKAQALRSFGLDAAEDTIAILDAVSQGPSNTMYLVSYFGDDYIVFEEDHVDSLEQVENSMRSWQKRGGDFIKFPKDAESPFAPYGTWTGKDDYLFLYKLKPKTSSLRLDAHLVKEYPALSRSFLQKLCSQGHITVNGKPEKPGYRLRAHDKVVVNHDMEAIGKIPDIDLPIIYQDDNILVINKPAGIISHARGKYWDEPSVASFVRQVTGQDGERPGIVHRLDRATSGVMVCAKNAAAMSFLQKQFAERSVKKIYIAIVKGHMKLPEAIIDMPIERNPKAPSTFRVGSNGKASRTHYRLISSNRTNDELQLQPATGRTHQLRVHLAHQGHPILGDNLYKGPKAPRLFLHAKQLTITLPGGATKTLTAPLPVEFKLFMEE